MFRFGDGDFRSPQANNSIELEWGTCPTTEATESISPTIRHISGVDPGVEASAPLPISESNASTLEDAKLAYNQWQKNKIAESEQSAKKALEHLVKRYVLCGFLPCDSF